MKKYIDVETVKAIARDWACCTEDLDAFMSEIGEASTSDVAPVVHAKDDAWEAGGVFACSSCGAWIGSIEGGSLDGEKFSFCPACGARMDAHPAAQ